MPRVTKNSEAAAALVPVDVEVLDPAGAVESHPIEIVQDDAGEKVVAPALIKARVLVACAFGECDDVIEVDAEVAKKHADVIDTNPAAVTYAESLAAQ